MPQSPSVFITIHTLKVPRTEYNVMSYIIKRRRYLLYYFTRQLSDVCLYSYTPIPGRAVMNLVKDPPPATTKLTTEYVELLIFQT